MVRLKEPYLQFVKDLRQRHAAERAERPIPPPLINAAIEATRGHLANIQLQSSFSTLRMSSTSNNTEQQQALQPALNVSSSSNNTMEEQSEGSAPKPSSMSNNSQRKASQPVTKSSSTSIDTRQQTLEAALTQLPPASEEFVPKPSSASTSSPRQALATIKEISASTDKRQLAFLSALSSSPKANRSQQSDSGPKIPSSSHPPIDQHFDSGLSLSSFTETYDENDYGAPEQNLASRQPLKGALKAPRYPHVYKPLPESDEELSPPTRSQRTPRRPATR